MVDSPTLELDRPQWVKNLEKLLKKTEAVAAVFLTSFLLTILMMIFLVLSQNPLEETFKNLDAIITILLTSIGGGTLIQVWVKHRESISNRIEFINEKTGSDLGLIFLVLSLFCWTISKVLVLLIIEMELQFDTKLTAILKSLCFLCNSWSILQALYYFKHKNIIYNNYVFVFLRKYKILNINSTNYQNYVNFLFMLSALIMVIATIYQPDQTRFLSSASIALLPLDLFITTPLLFFALDETYKKRKFHILRIFNFIFGFSIFTSQIFTLPFPITTFITIILFLSMKIIFVLNFAGLAFSWYFEHLEDAWSAVVRKGEELNSKEGRITKLLSEIAKKEEELNFKEEEISKLLLEIARKKEELDSKEERISKLLSEKTLKEKELDLKQKEIEKILTQKQEELREQRRQMNHHTKNTLNLLVNDITIFENKSNYTNENHQEVLIKIIKNRIIAAVDLHEQLHSSKIGPVILIKSYINKALENIEKMYKFSPENLEIKLDLDSDLDSNLYFSVTNAQNIGKSIAELVSNICIHAYPNIPASKRVLFFEAKLLREIHALSIEIKDKGVGFDTKEAINSKGYGFSFIRQVVEVDLHGKFTFQSVIGVGSEFNLFIPIDHKQNHRV